jgi:toxin ParE1/3/4
MVATCGFHPGAQSEYLAAARYYLAEASAEVAAGFITEIETAIAAVLSAPTLYRVIAPPGIRRYLLRRYPYALFYRWDPAQQHVAVYAVMHLSRAPDYWRLRLS